MPGCDYAPSLLEKHQDGSEVDFPLPLATTDERERLIYEKDEEVRFFTAWLTYSWRFAFSLLSFLQLRKMQEVLERIQEQMQHTQRGGC